MVIKYDELKDLIKRAFLNAGIAEEKAEILASVHADSTLKGVNSHGIDRVPKFIELIGKDLVDIDAEMELVNSFGAMENYDGNLGIGILNALKASERATELAKEYGIGLVGLRNTTHWMRGGLYTEKMAERGFIGLCWTNTESIVPAWGATSPSIGNNPLGIAIPAADGDIALDMAMSQYSYGKLETTKLAGEDLPYPGGFDSDGNLTVDPAAIERTRRLLPIGYWKGSGLTIALDMIAAMMSNGNSTYDMDDDPRESFCTACSQIFIAINPEAFRTKESNDETIAKMKDSIHGAEAVDADNATRYPGEGASLREKQNKEFGMTIDDGIYEKVKNLQNKDKGLLQKS